MLPQRVTPRARGVRSGPYVAVDSPDVSGSQEKTAQYGDTARYNNAAPPRVLAANVAAGPAGEVDA